jgi:MFS family permease
MKPVRLLIGISVFWLPLSMLSDGLTALVLPSHLIEMTDKASRATVLGVITFIGIIVGMLIQPVAGVYSDRLRPSWGRRGVIGLGVVLILLSLLVFGLSQVIVAVLVGYLLIQVAMNIAQAAQQGFIPDLIPAQLRGAASGLKGLLDIGGALVGFTLLGHLLVTGQGGPPLFAIALALVIAFLLTVVLVPEPTQPAQVRGPRTALLNAFRLDFREHRSFAWLVVSRFLFLLGAYAVGRFLLYFVAERLALDPAQAGEAAGNVLAGLTLITAVASLPSGWAADRIGRVPLMLLGAVLSAIGALLLITAHSTAQILGAGSLMAIGSAAFAGANWALTADLAPLGEAGRFMAIANYGTAGASAAAGLFGPLVDWANAGTPGSGYVVLFGAAALAFLLSAVAIRGVVSRQANPVVSET